jgi:cytochrome c556
VEYSPDIGVAVINAFAATGATIADYFPEGSHDPERSRAAESIWEDMDGFLAQVDEFRSAVASAAEAPIDDAEAFQAAIEPVLARCGECHGAYRD